MKTVLDFGTHKLEVEQDALIAAIGGTLALARLYRRSHELDTEDRATTLEEVAAERRRVAELEEKTARDLAEADAGHAAAEEELRKVIPIAEALKRQTFTATPLFPLNRNGEPLPATNPRVKAFLQLHAQLAKRGD